MAQADDTRLTEPSSRPTLVGAIRDRLSRVLGAAGNMLAPAVCLGCHDRIAAHDALCAGCWQQVSFITPPLCDRLGLPLPFGGEGPLISAAAAANPPAYDRARAAAVFDHVVRELIHGSSTPTVTRLAGCSRAGWLVQAPNCLPMPT